MCSLDGLDVEVHLALVLPDGRVPGVCERARGTVAEAGHVVLVPAKVLPVGLGLVAAVAMVDDLYATAVFIRELFRPRRPCSNSRPDQQNVLCGKASTISQRHLPCRRWCSCCITLASRDGHGL